MSIDLNVIEELIDELEDLKNAKRERIGTTRTKVESNELKGEVSGIDEAVYKLRKLVKAARVEESSK